MLNFFISAWRNPLTKLQTQFDDEDYEEPPLVETQEPAHKTDGPTTHRQFSRRRRRAYPSLQLTHLRLTCFVSRRTLIYRALYFIPLVFLSAVLFLIWGGVPPSFRTIREFEDRLPHHLWNDTANTEARYLRFPGHLWGHGLNNVLQEAIIMAHLSDRVNRSYVFEDYTWSRSPFPFTLYDFALRPKRIPLNAFVSGPIAGGLLPTIGTIPAVSQRYWEVACPKGGRAVLTTETAPTYLDGKELVDWWVRTLEDVKDERCVEIDSNLSGKKVFDWNFFGSKSILSLWPDLRESSILSSFTWSPLVRAAVTRNFALLRSPPTTNAEKESSVHDDISLFEGLIAVHIRRGDYRRHCARLAGWNSSYMGINQHPDLPDRFEPPSYVSDPPSDMYSYVYTSITRAGFNNGGIESPTPNETKVGVSDEHYTDATEVERVYFAHCLPTAQQIVERMHSVRLAHPSLKSVYLMTNARSSWIDELYILLMEDGWGSPPNGTPNNVKTREGWLASSHDLILDREQRYVGVAADMAIAGRAEVFLGNGFSSLSSNVVMLRMAKGLKAETNRFL